MLSDWTGAPRGGGLWASVGEDAARQAKELAKARLFRVLDILALPNRDVHYGKG
jgi:hypothetical protein